MFALLARVAATAGSFGSLIRLAFTLRQPGESLSLGQWTLVLVGALLASVAVGWEIQNYAKHRPWVKDPNKVPAFLKGWVEEAGRVAIFSRDMSWVGKDIGALLSTKAQAGELLLILPRPTALSRELDGLGAEVIHYPELGYTIRSRFTIVNLDRADTAVAVGYRLPNGKHRIDRFNAGTDPAFYLAQDMMELMRRLQQARGDQGQ
jgi:hypothetical protein